MSVEEKATVLEIRGGNALVRAKENSMCAGCASAGHCQSSDGERTVEAKNPLGARAGDEVVIAVPSSALLKASFVVYFLPVIGLLAGAAAAQILFGGSGDGETPSAAAGIGGIVGALLTVAATRLYVKKNTESTDVQPVIVRIT